MQLNELRLEKEQLKDKNVCLKALKDEETSQLVELEQPQKKNEWLVKQKDKAEAQLCNEREQIELVPEISLEEQHQLYEDIQAQLAKAIERARVSLL